ncbi:MAG: DUF4129 domain-containing protein [Sulfolobales archaeon]
MNFNFKCFAIVACFLLILYAVAFNASIDPSPLLELFNDVVVAITSGDYELADRLINTALGVRLPSDIEYVHKTAYLRLRGVVDVLRSSKSLGDLNNASYLRTLIYDLNRAYYDLNSSMTSYLNSIFKYFLDYRLRDYYVGRVNRSLETLHNVVNDVLSTMLFKYLGITSNIINVSVEAPLIIYGGDEFVLRIRISMPEDVDSDYATLTVYINYGGIYSYISTSVSTDGHVELKLKAPSAEDFVSGGYRLQSELAYELLVRVYVEVSDNLYIGQTSFRGVLKFLLPDLRITPYVNGSRLEFLLIEALITHPINTSIYVDGELISTLELLNGSNEVLLSKDLSVGKHVVRVVTSPRAYYMSGSWAYELVVGQIPPKVSITQRGFSLGPPFNVLLDVSIDSTPYRLKLIIDGNLVFNDLLNSTATSLAIQLPWTSVIWRDIDVFVEPLNPKYSLFSGSIRVYVINIPLIALLVITPSLLFISHDMRRRIKHLMVVLPRYIPLIGVSGDEDVVTTTQTGVSFRRSKLYRLYRRLVVLISVFAEPPQPHETLREFLLRIKGLLTKELYEFIALFIHNYELDLYSNHEVDINGVREALRRFERSVKKL